jgi:hypothetical protein
MVDAVSSSAETYDSVQSESSSYQHRFNGSNGDFFSAHLYL